MAAASTPAERAALLQRLLAGLPLEHVLGWAELCGRRVAVKEGVFVPRRRTELLETSSLQAPHAVATFARDGLIGRS
ncbi:MAG: hypothetical protein ACR2GL_07450 [Thermoleophilaceae bacterium]